MITLGPRELLLSLIGRGGAAASQAAHVRRAHNVATDTAMQGLVPEGESPSPPLQDAEKEVWPRAFQVNVAVAIDMAATLGVWKRLRNKECVIISEVVKSTGAHVPTAIRIMRQLTAAGLLSDVPGLGEPGYAITHLGRPYTDPDHVSFNRFILREVVPAAGTLAEQRCFRAPGDAGGPGCPPGDPWLRLAQDPGRARDMARGMRSLSSGALAATAYPFGSELAGLGGGGDDDVAIVDVAGGQGHVMGEVRARNPGLRGRVVVQDLGAVLDAAPGGPPAGVEFMAHDMFRPQPIRTARAYHLRHVMHNWDDDAAAVILGHLAPIVRARPSARLLLVDLILPAAGAAMQEAARDFTMFRVGGMERTEAQWRQLLARSGLGIKKIWRGSEPEACVECAWAGT